MFARLFAALLALASFGAAARAAEEPDIVRTEVESAEKECRNDGGRPVQKPNFLRVRDLNGDGGEDWIVDYAKFECRGTVPSQPFCGSGGCSLIIYLWSGGSTWTQAFDETVQAYRFTKVNGRPALQVDLGGATCGKANAETCRESYVYEGAKLVPLRKRRQ